MITCRSGPWPRQPHSSERPQVNSRAFRPGKQSLRGGIIEQRGKFADVATNVVIDRILRVITTTRDGRLIMSVLYPIAAAQMLGLESLNTAASDPMRPSRSAIYVR